MGYVLLFGEIALQKVHYYYDGVYDTKTSSGDQNAPQPEGRAFD